LEPNRWYHAGDKLPEYEMTVLDEVEEGGQYRHIISEHVSCVLSRFV
jgi:hypothetical protein